LGYDAVVNNLDKIKKLIKLKRNKNEKLVAELTATGYCERQLAQG